MTLLITLPTAEPSLGAAHDHIAASAVTQPTVQESDLPDLPAAPQQDAEDELNLPAAPAMRT